MGERNGNFGIRLTDTFPFRLLGCNLNVSLQVNSARGQRESLKPRRKLRESRGFF
jgi:hypothetical protein